MTADRIPLDAETLRDAVVPASPMWRQIDVVAETRSTNADLLVRAEQTDIDGMVLIAEHQTAGRGRRGRTWSGVPGTQIIMSVGVDVGAVPSSTWGWLPLATGVAVVDAVTSLGVSAGLKWPNDVVADDRKLAGILAEVCGSQKAVVIGIGLNVSLRADEVGVPNAVSMTELTETAPDRQQLVCRLLGELGARLGSWRDARGADPRLLSDYRARSATLGQRVRALLPGDREIVGTACDVDEQGRLTLVVGDRTVSVSAGDIVHLRPGDGIG